MGGTEGYVQHAVGLQEQYEVYFNATLNSSRPTTERFIPLAGYQIPMVEGGEFSLAGGVAYRTEWSVESADDGRMGDRQSTSVRQPFVNFRGSILYGISNEFETLISFEYSPAISRGSRTFTYLWPFAQVLDSYVGTLHRESLLAKMTLTYHSAAKWELSLRGTYSDYRRPSIGSEIAPFSLANYFKTSTTRIWILDVRAGITIPVL